MVDVPSPSFIAILFFFSFSPFPDSFDEWWKKKNYECFKMPKKFYLYTEINLSLTVSEVGTEVYNPPLSTRLASLSLFYYQAKYAVRNSPYINA